MSSLPVFADALSRLQADIALVRLVRAGIPAGRISAIFPRRRAPNGVCCWLKNFNRIPRTSWPVAAAGLLGSLFKAGLRAAHVEQELDELGLSPDTARRLLERTEDDRIVLFVHARTRKEATTAWQVFKRVGLENINLPDRGFAPLFDELPVATPSLEGIAA